MAAGIEEAHQKDHIDEQHPILLDRDARIFQPCSQSSTLSVTVPLSLFLHYSGFSFCFHDLEGVRLGEPPTECDDEDGWCSAKPEKGAPAVRGGGDELDH
jgi:hypothetical protein